MKQTTENQTKQTGIRYILFLIGIVLTNVLVMADLPVYVIVNDLYGTYPNNMGAVNFVISGTALLVMLSSLIAPAVIKKAGNKNILVIAGTIFSVAAIACAYVDNVYMLAVLRAVCGVMMGSTNVAAVALLTNYYEDDNQRAKYIGYYNTAMPLMGSALSAIAGVLALNGWQNIFHTFWLSVVMVILIIFFVPADVPVREETTAQKVQQKHSMDAKFWYMTASFFLVVLGTMMMQMFYSVYIVEHELGDAAFIGLVNTVIGFGSVLANFVFGYTYSKIGRKVIYVYNLLPIIGALILIFLPGKITVFVGYFLAMAGYGMSFSTAYAYTPTLVHKEHMESAIGIATATYAIGTFLATYAVTGLMTILKVDRFTDIIPIITAVFVIMVIAEILLPKHLKKQAE